MQQPPVLSLRSATLGYGQRLLWRDVSLDVHPGEFIAVLGSNGTGKTSLLKVILGQQRLTSGTVEFLGRAVSRGSREMGYIPQQKLLGQTTPLRARDLVALGVNGHRWGLPIPSGKVREQVDAAIEAVGASAYRDSALAALSGGEQQRIRVAQSIVGGPKLLLCDEPLLSLDLNHQRGVSELINGQRKALNMAVVFVTHDVNPILPMVDRVLYLAGGRFTMGTPEEVFRSDVLSGLYGTPVEVLRSGERVVVVGTPDEHDGHLHDEHEPVKARSL